MARRRYVPYRFTIPRHYLPLSGHSPVIKSATRAATATAAQLRPHASIFAPTHPRVYEVPGSHLQLAAEVEAQQADSEGRHRHEVERVRREGGWRHDAADLVKVDAVGDGARCGVGCGVPPECLHSSSSLFDLTFPSPWDWRMLYITFSTKVRAVCCTK